MARKRRFPLWESHIKKKLIKCHVHLIIRDFETERAFENTFLQLRYRNLVTLKLTRVSNYP